jgi:hypothetical protein
LVKFIQEVDLLLNDGSKHINVVGWRKNASLPQRVETSRRRSRRCLLMSLALAKTSDQQVFTFIHYLHVLVSKIGREGSFLSCIIVVACSRYVLSLSRGFYMVPSRLYLLNAFLSSFFF